MYMYVKFILVTQSSDIELTLRTDPDGKEQKLECAWAPFNKSQQPLDWMGLAEHEVMFPHMQLRELKEEDSMSGFISAMESMPAMKALLLVNITNSLIVDTKYLLKEDGPSVPTLVVARETGVLLKEHIKVHKEKVEVRVDIVSKEEKLQSEQSSFIPPGMCIIYVRVHLVYIYT